MRMRTTPSIAAILAGSALLIGLTVTANAQRRETPSVLTGDVDVPESGVEAKLRLTICARLPT
jgi:hypothetical protein